MVLVIARDRVAILRVGPLPPGLAHALARPPRDIRGDAVLVCVAKAPHRLGLRGGRALEVHVAPTVRAQDVLGGERSDLQREQSSAPGRRLGAVAAQVRLALAIRSASHHLSALLTAVLNPILVGPAGGVFRAIEPFVRAIEVRRASVVQVVGLEGLAHSSYAPAESVQAILVGTAGHAVFVPEPADPILHVRERLLVPPERQALVQHVVHDGPVRAVAAIVGLMAELVRLAEDLLAVRPAGLRRRPHARGEGHVRCTLPATFPAIQLARDIEAAIILPRALRVADLGRDGGVHGCEASGGLLLPLLLLLQASKVERSDLGLELRHHRRQLRILTLREVAVDVVVHVQEHLAHVHDLVDEPAVDPVALRALPEVLEGHREGPRGGVVFDVEGLIGGSTHGAILGLEPEVLLHGRRSIKAGLRERVPHAVALVLDRARGLRQECVARPITLTLRAIHAHAAPLAVGDCGGIRRVLTEADGRSRGVPVRAVRATLTFRAALLLQVEAEQVVAAVFQAHRKALHALALGWLSELGDVEPLLLRGGGGTQRRREREPTAHGWHRGGRRLGAEPSVRSSAGAAAAAPR
mmetsp:Transcript_8179/g.29762  ORF Transcript_8179/g.29762 Transcript_8179/m.29762 type:complete len:583 (-) Transcript_8179:17-1765(-)